MDFLQLTGRTILLVGLSNRKSVAYQVGQVLQEAGAKVLYAVHSEARKESLSGLLPKDAEVYVCDVQDDHQIARLKREVCERHPVLGGILHAVAFAEYHDPPWPFHETPKGAFLRSVDVSCYSLIALCREFKPNLAADASVVTISISTTRMASENYGYMAPVKAALESSLAFLAKSFSRDTRIRFNAVAAGLLKTSSSAGIPNYVRSFLFGEMATLRKEALKVQEVANVAAFLLSPRSSGINAQRIIVDAGMEVNYFDQDIVRGATALTNDPPK